jgi:hypothetical protein
MAETLKIPQFETEGEEARWWAQNQGPLALAFQRASAEGKLGRGTVARRGNTPTTTIRLDPDDIRKARVYAARRGIKYQTYLKSLIHQALRQEESGTGFPNLPKEMMMPKTPMHPGLDGRSRDEDGEIRRKRGDTLVRTLRETYGDDFAKGYRSDTKLDTVLEREGLDDLSQLLKRKRK